LTAEQARETFSTPETVPFWQIPESIEMAERAGLSAAGYRLQYQKLLAGPFMLVAMVLLAAAFSLRFFRIGGVQRMVLAGVTSGFMLYVISKLTDDLAVAALIAPALAAWLPVIMGAMTGFVALLHLEDG
jgi:lipopolysaccharide export system permease protein